MELHVSEADESYILKSQFVRFSFKILSLKSKNSISNFWSSAASNFIFLNTSRNTSDL